MNAVANIEQGTALAPIDKLKSNLTSRADEFKTALPAHIGFDKFQRTIATAAMSNPQLLECDRRSLLLAAMKLAQDGLLPDGREAALVPFKQSRKEGNEWVTTWNVQPMPMAWGLRKKILQSGMVVSLETGLVYRAEVESGHFIYEIGLEPPIRHRPDLSLSGEEMTDENIVAAYSIARIKNEGGGDPYWSVEVMRRAEIDKVRQTSQTGATVDKRGKPRNPSGPWVDWFGEMARKTVLRRHSKVLPMSGDIFDTIEREDEHLAAEGTARLLETEEAAPLRLPTGDELAEQEGAEDETVDPDTGEVTTDSRGMTEVDEETARKLDAEQQGQVETEPEPEPEPEPESDQAGTPEEQSEAEAEPAAEAQPEGRPNWLDKLRAQIAAADNLAAVNIAGAEWDKRRVAYPDETIAEIDALVSQAYARVRTGGARAGRAR